MGYLMCDFSVALFDISNSDEWDLFINNSVNGTFLQSRKFLNYHPSSRFKDISLMIYDKKGHLAALIPACEIIDDSIKKNFISHKGSTFGGIILNQKNYAIEKVISIIQVIERYLKKENFNKIQFTITSDLFSKKSSDLLQYCLHYMRYTVYDELSLYVDFSTYKEDIYSNLSQGKRTDVNNCIKAGMVCERLLSDEQICEFYSILCETLEKYHTKPVHSINELLDFKNSRLIEICDFWGIYLNNKMVAGSMMFYFDNNVAHTQYLCALSDYNKLSPMTFLYYSMLVKMKSLGFQKVSWGGTTEEHGKIINMGLAKSKEAFGSQYYINRTFEKRLE